MPMRGILPVCCPRAASGHATTAPPSVAKNSRRSMWLAMRPSGWGSFMQWRDDTTLMKASEMTAAPSPAGRGLDDLARRLVAGRLQSPPVPEVLPVVTKNFRVSPDVNLLLGTRNVGQVTQGRSRQAPAALG